MKRFVSILAIVVTFAAVTYAADENQKELDRVKAAGTVLNEIMATPDKGIPAEILKGADCVAIVPSMLKGGFVVGGRYGQGIASCRHGNSWSAPAPFRIAGGSWGLQIGGEAVDLVMLIMNQKGMNQLLDSKFKIGADVSGAAGPVGRHAEGSTDWKFRSEVLTYSRARGAFAGVTLNGAAITQNDDDTRALYGRVVPFRQILSGSVAAPAGTQPFLSEIARYFGEAKAGDVNAKTNTGGTTGSASDESSAKDTSRSSSGAVASSSGNMSSSDVKDNIQKALQDTPGVNSSNIKVNVTQDKVELTGTVPSDKDRSKIRKLAEQNSGGRTVDDSGLNVQ